MLSTKEKQAMLRRLYPDSTRSLLSEIRVPGDLASLFDESRNVARYVDASQTPDGVVDDNLQDHLCRLEWRIVTLPTEYVKRLPIGLIDRCQRQLWCHDAGELGNSKDVVVTAKVADDKVAEKARLNEDETARGYLSDDDYALYCDFELAGDFLRGKTDKPPQEYSFLSKTMDFVDGPLVYFYFYTKWLDGHEYDGKVPPRGVFIYTRAENTKFRQNILKAEGLDIEVRDLCLYLLSEQIKVVVSLWDEVEQDKVPSVMARELGLMRNED